MDFQTICQGMKTSILSDLTGDKNVNIFCPQKNSQKIIEQSATINHFIKKLQ
jgi:hypothetical protein